MCYPQYLVNVLTIRNVPKPSGEPKPESRKPGDIHNGFIVLKLPSQRLYMWPLLYFYSFPIVIQVIVPAFSPSLSL